MRTMFIFLSVLLGCASQSATNVVDLSQLCVLPGSSVDELIASCSTAKFVTGATEEGPLPAYEISDGDYDYVAEIYAGRVELIRFTANPLPIHGLAIGDEFEQIRSQHQEYQLLAGAEEAGYIALVDELHDVYLSFNTSMVPTDWYFANKLDESAIGKIQLQSVNFGDEPMSNR